jgi:copper chaperone CopZ
MKINFGNMAIVQKIKVEGMTCNNCRAHVEREISEIDGIEEVSADLTTGEVSISGHNINYDQIKDAVERAGYSFKGRL